MKRVGATLWKPVYKSEKKPKLDGGFDWNIVNLLSTDIVDRGSIDQDFRIQFF